MLCTYLGTLLPFPSTDTVLNLGGTRPRTRWLANIPTGKYACVVLVMYAPYAYEGACACVRPPEHIYYRPLVVDIFTADTSSNTGKTVAINWCKTTIATSQYHPLNSDVNN